MDLRVDAEETRSIYVEPCRSIEGSVLSIPKGQLHELIIWFEEAFTEEYSSVGKFVNSGLRDTSVAARYYLLCYGKLVSSLFKKTFFL
jgi:hypothetical protein